jgi:ribulose-phosphate 3-epimerase
VLREPRIIASVLGADYAHLGDEVSALAQAGVDGIQWDIMDGCFVPDISFGAAVVEACREAVDLPFEAHLMVTHPSRHIRPMVDSGCQMIIIHAEASRDVLSEVSTIRSLGAEAGVALSPRTPIRVAEPWISGIDQLLIMTVEPGAAGQAYRPEIEAKISEARRLLDDRGIDIPIEVDGGLNPTTMARARRAGADVFVSGSWIRTHPQGKHTATQELRGVVTTVPEGP